MDKNLTHACDRLMNGTTIFTPRISNAGTSDGVKKAWETRKGGTQAWHDLPEGDHIVHLPVKATLYVRNPEGRDSIWTAEEGTINVDRKEDVTVDGVPHTVTVKNYPSGKDVGSMTHPNMDRDILPIAKKQHKDVVGIGQFTWNRISDAAKNLGKE